MGPLLEINFTSNRPKERGDRPRGRHDCSAVLCKKWEDEFLCLISSQIVEAGIISGKKAAWPRTRSESPEVRGQWQLGSKLAANVLGDKKKPPGSVVPLWGPRHTPSTCRNGSRQPPEPGAQGRVLHRVSGISSLPWEA